MKSLEQTILEATPEDLHIDDTTDIIDKLKDAFCEEMLAWYQYYIGIPFLAGPERTNVVADYKENASEELSHADMILNRINELGGDFEGIDSPASWNRLATHKYIMPAGTDVKESLEQMTDAERGAIETYTALESITRDADPVTNDIVKHILADEQKHLQEMLEFLEDIK